MYRYALLLFSFFISLETVILLQYRVLKNYFESPVFFICFAAVIIALITLVVIWQKVNFKLHIKDKAIVIKTMIYTIIGLSAFNVIVLSLNTFVNLNLTKGEIESTFRKNSDTFKIAAEYLEHEPGNIRCYIADNQIKIVQIDSKYKETPIYLKDKAVIDSLEVIFKKLHYKEVSKRGNEINFLLHPVKAKNGYDDGIAYYSGEIKKGTRLRNQSYSKIFGNWYYFSTGYV